MVRRGNDVFSVSGSQFFIESAAVGRREFPGFFTASPVNIRIDCPEHGGQFGIGFVHNVDQSVIAVFREVFTNAEFGVIPVFVPVDSSHEWKRESCPVEKFRRRAPFALSQKPMACSMRARQSAVQTEKRPFGDHKRTSAPIMNPGECFWQRAVVDIEFHAFQIRYRILVERHHIAKFSCGTPDPFMIRADSRKTAAEKEMVGINFPDGGADR